MRFNAREELITLACPSKEKECPFLGGKVFRPSFALLNARDAPEQITYILARSYSIVKEQLSWNAKKLSMKPSRSIESP